MPSLPPPVDERYLIPGHCGKSIYERFWPKVDVRSADECWPWLACVGKTGYGRFGAGWQLGGPQTWFAPMVAYTLAVGPIPEGKALDHVCHTRDTTCPAGFDCLHRRCVNPWHLEPVTFHENSLRREARRDWTNFPCGHPREGNTAKAGNATRCALCHRISQRIYRASKRAA